jgi:predicted ATPase
MLVTIDENGRYQIHELLRHYAADKLADTDEAQHAQTAHSQHYLHNLHQLPAASFAMLFAHTGAP